MILDFLKVLMKGCVMVFMDLIVIFNVFMN